MLQWEVNVKNPQKNKSGFVVKSPAGVGLNDLNIFLFRKMILLTVHSFSSSAPVFTLSKSSPPQFRTCLLLPSLRSMSGAGPERLGSSRKLRIGLSPSG